MNRDFPDFNTYMTWGMTALAVLQVLQSRGMV